MLPAFFIITIGDTLSAAILGCRIKNTPGPARRNTILPRKSRTKPFELLLPAAWLERTSRRGAIPLPGATVSKVIQTVRTTVSVIRCGVAGGAIESTVM